MAIREAISQLISMIEASTPPSDIDHGFVCVQNADGMSPDIYERSGNIRYFDIDQADQLLPMDDADAGLSGRKRGFRTVRVRYDIPHDMGLLQNIVSEDSAHLIDVLKGPDYIPALTQITTVIPRAPSIEILYDQEGAVLAWLVKIPIEILFKN